MKYEAYEAWYLAVKKNPGRTIAILLLTLFLSSLVGLTTELGKKVTTSLFNSEYDTEPEAQPFPLEGVTETSCIEESEWTKREGELALDWQHWITFNERARSDIVPDVSFIKVEFPVNSPTGNAPPYLYVPEPKDVSGEGFRIMFIKTSLVKATMPPRTHECARITWKATWPE